jgi:protein arginine N-methyltransferase 2
MLLTKVQKKSTEEDKKKKMDAQGFGDNNEYLRCKLTYDKNSVEGLLLDEKEDAVMMSWETSLMKEHARIICHNKGSVLNVGHGMGIVDRAIQVKI